MNEQIAVVGIGYVGLTTAACFADLGFKVIGFDIDTDKVSAINGGQMPFYEPGLSDIVGHRVRSGDLVITHNIEQIRSADIVFLAVPTPATETGDADISFIVAAAENIAPLLPANCVVVNKSTVPVGTQKAVSTIINRPDVAVVSNPEFLREGSAVNDFMHPDRVVIGADIKHAACRVANLYKDVSDNIVVTDPESAELIKYATNGFLAMKISYANDLAYLCERSGANATDVLAALGEDQRIGSKFLTPGPGWGGSCFPKDTRALLATAREYETSLPLVDAAITVNNNQIDRMATKIKQAVGALSFARIAAFGLTFKAHTDDLRESPAVQIMKRIQQQNAIVSIFDPSIRFPEGKTHIELDCGLTARNDPWETVRNADALVVLTEWPMFAARFEPSLLGVRMRNRTLVDLRNIMDHQRFIEAGFDVHKIG